MRSPPRYIKLLAGDGMHYDISIIIPCFNGAQYIARLSASVRAVLTPNVEVIFVDDGSEDESLEKFQCLVPEAICVRQENRGLGATRNRAANMARGEFLQLLDADDTLEPGKFEAQLRFARAQSLDVVYSDWRMLIVDGEKLISEPWVKAEANTEVVAALLGGWWYPPNAALVRRTAFLEAGGCDPELGNTCEDFDLWVRLGICGYRFGYTPGRYANYHRDWRVRSMSRKDPREFFEGEVAIVMKAIALLESRNVATEARRRAAAQRLNAVARNVYNLDRSWYRRLVREIRTLDPYFRPTGSFPYRMAALLFGIERAERLAVWNRQFVRRN